MSEPPQPTVPQIIVARLCPHGHLPAKQVGGAPFCPRCGMSPQVQPAPDPNWYAHNQRKDER